MQFKNFANILYESFLQCFTGLQQVAAPKPRVPYAELDQYKGRPFRCHFCTGAFKKLMHLKRHMSTHTGEKKYKCDDCDK